MAAIAAALVVLLGGTAWLTSIIIGKPAPTEVTAFRVNGNGPQPNAFAFGVLDTKTNEAYLVANGLQPLTPGQVYELWWLPADKSAPVAAGTFTTDSQGSAHHAVKAPDELSKFSGVAVTEEKAPGVQVPAGPIVLVGNFSLH
jgi:hypothetical protein